MKCPILGHFQGFETIRVLCRLTYLVIGMFQKAQYLVVILSILFVFQRFFKLFVGVLLAHFITFITRIIHNGFLYYSSLDSQRF